MFHVPASEDDDALSFSVAAAFCCRCGAVAPAGTWRCSSAFEGIPHFPSVRKGADCRGAQVLVYPAEEKKESFSIDICVTGMSRRSILRLRLSENLARCRTKSCPAHAVDGRVYGEAIGRVDLASVHEDGGPYRDCRVLPSRRARSRSLQMPFTAYPKPRSTLQSVAVRRAAAQVNRVVFESRQGSASHRNRKLLPRPSAQLYSARGSSSSQTSSPPVSRTFATRRNSARKTSRIVDAVHRLIRCVLTHHPEHASTCRLERFQICKTHEREKHGRQVVALAKEQLHNTLVFSTPRPCPRRTKPCLHYF